MAIALSGSLLLTGSLTTTGTITAQILNVQQVTSSVVYSSGSNIFGNSLANTQVMTGSVTITGSLSVNGTSSVVGSGTTNQLSKFTGANTIGNSQIFDNGSFVGIGRTTNANAGWKLAVQDGLTIAQGTTETQLFGYFGSAGVGTFSNHNFRIRTNNVDRAIFDTSGNLGLGVTPSAWNAAFKVFQVGTSSALWDAVGTLGLSTNVYNDGANRYIGNGFASRYTQEAGVHQWLTAPSGTAGNAISFTQAMTLGANGNLLIGTDADTGLYKLDVNGTGRFSGALAVQNSRLGLGIRSSNRGELFLNSAGTNDVSDLFFGFGNGYTQEENIRWALSDRGTTSGDLVFFTGPANGGFLNVLSLNKSGAATFSSSVTASSLLSNTWVGAQGIRFDSAPTIQGVYLGNSGTTFTDYATIEMVGGTSGGCEIDFTKPGFDVRGRVGYDLTSDYMWFTTGGATERMRITSGGNLLIGTDADTGLYKLDVNGNGRFSNNIRLGVGFNDQASITFGDAGTPYWTIGRNASSTNFSINSYAISNILQINPTSGAATFSSSVTANGNLISNSSIFTSSIGGLFFTGAVNNFSNGIFPSAGNMNFQVGSQIRMTVLTNGAVFINNLSGYSNSNSDVRYDTSTKELYYQTSSLRYKTNIINLEDSLQKITSLRPVRYQDKNRLTYSCGLIAEEVAKIIPDVVFKSKIEGFEEPQIDGINYSDIVPFLIKAIQELNEKVTQLENK